MFFHSHFTLSIIFIHFKKINLILVSRENEHEIRRRRSNRSKSVPKPHCFFISRFIPKKCGFGTDFADGLGLACMQETEPLKENAELCARDEEYADFNFVANERAFPVADVAKLRLHVLLLRKSLIEQRHT